MLYCGFDVEYERLLREISDIEIIAPSEKNRGERIRFGSLTPKGIKLPLHRNRNDFRAQNKQIYLLFIIANSIK